MVNDAGFFLLATPWLNVRDLDFCVRERCADIFRST